MADPYEHVSEFEDLERVETHIQFLREDYRMLTNRIDYHLQERSRLEGELRKLKGVAARIKGMREDGDI